MALPINNTLTYTLTVPSTGQEIKYRPFLVKDEKTLLLAHQSEDVKVMIDSLKNVITSCVKDDINVNDLATFDIEYIFTQIRAKSVGEIVELFLKCDTCEDEKAVTKINLDISKIPVTKNEKHKSDIILYDDVGITLKYPSFSIVNKLGGVEAKGVDDLFNIIIECIDTIYNSTEVFHVKEQTKEELTDFLNNLTSDQFKKIQEFFETLPVMKQEIDYKCPVCNKEHHKVLEGLQSFFLINLSHESLQNFYKMNFAMMQYHKYSLEDLENMIPFEREIYVTMLINHLEEEKKKYESKN